MTLDPTRDLDRRTPRTAGRGFQKTHQRPPDAMPSARPSNHKRRYPAEARWIMEHPSDVQVSHTDDAAVDIGYQHYVVARPAEIAKRPTYRWLGAWIAELLQQRSNSSAVL